jgi:hypothetical protein
MMHPLVPLKDQLAALATTVQDQVQQTVALNLLSSASSGSSATGATTMTTAMADEEAGEGLRTTHTMEFPKYDGVGDPLPWLNRCE